jgi:two-component system, OmpR family, response regulator VicR
VQLHFLVIDDDKAVLDTFRYVAKENYPVTYIHATNLAEGIQLLKKDKFDILVLNPKVRGLSAEAVIRCIRAASDIPLMTLSCKPSLEEQSYYIDAGADACMSTPLSIQELRIRAKAIYRRTYLNSHAESKTFGNLVINPQDFTATKNKKTIALTKTEFSILQLLVNSPQRVFTKSEIFRLLRDYGDKNNGNIINVHIRRMRLKLEDDPCHPTLILTRWGFGYQIGSLGSESKV